MKAPSLTDIPEKTWQTQVVQLAQTLGWRRPFHVYDSRRSEHGWPDLALVRDRLIFAELKRQTGKPTDHQIDWLNALTRAGVECYLWRPADLDEVARILAHRGRPQFTPRTLWRPLWAGQQEHTTPTDQEVIS